MKPLAPMWSATARAAALDAPRRTAGGHLLVGMVLALALASNATSLADGITLTLPPDARAVSGVALARGAEKLSLKAAVDGDRIVFPAAQAGMTYDLRIRLADGRELRGADMNWYAPEPADPAARPLSDDDRQEIQEICNVPSFYDRVQVARYQGTHQRCTVLVNLVRDRDFHAGKGEVIWRAEVWYFKFQAGGWEKISQQTLLLDRQRYPTRAAYEQAIAAVRFLPRLGGISVTREHPSIAIELTSADLAAAVQLPTTRPEAPK